MLKVVFFQRKPMNGQYSIENIFSTVRRYLPSEINTSVAISKFYSKGIFRRIINILLAFFHQGDINHITGDVHFLSYLLRKKHTLLTVHDCISILKAKSPLKKWLIKTFWYSIPCRRVRYITVVSEKTKNELKSIVNYNAEIYVIPDPVLPKFQKSLKVFNKKKPVILQINGGIFENKNLTGLINAVQDIECELNIIGPLTEEYVHLLDERKIEYQSNSNLSTEELYQEYKKADIVFFASTYEGFGMPIIEAQAIGRPVVTSNISPMKEVAGDGACIVDPYNISEIRDIIKKIIIDVKYRNTIVEQGFINVRKYRPEYIAGKYANIYKKIKQNNKKNIHNFITIKYGVINEREDTKRI